MKVILSILFMALYAFAQVANQYYSMTSPAGRIVVQLSAPGGKLQYTADFDQRPVVLPSGLELVVNNEQRLQNCQIGLTEQTVIDETWHPVWGQRNTIRHKANRYLFEITEKTAQPNLSIEFQIADDGFAFRYLFNGTPGDSMIIARERTSFALPAGTTAWWTEGDFNSYERLYQHTDLGKIDSAHTPLTLELPSGKFAAIHEAALLDYAGFVLHRDETDPNLLYTDLEPWPDGIRVKAVLPHRSPWRMVQVADTPGGLIESDLVLNLNEPCRLEDTSWIKPMRYLGIWWGLHIGKETWYEGRKLGATNENTRAYIDFAAKHGIEGLLVEGWNVDWNNWNFNFLKENNRYNLPEMAAYAREKNVTLIVHNETAADVANYERQIHEAYRWYQSLDLHAIKSGYVGSIKPHGFTHHGQYMVNHYQRVVELAARHKIMLDVHEPVKPTGISRTWPNMMTREGHQGNEYNAWSGGNPPDHTTILPFTRMLAGPLDHTPGIFDITFDRYKKENRVHTTLVQQAALTVILFSPMQMFADLIENYQDHPAFEVMNKVPATWDESHVLAGVIGDYIVMARRSGKRWFIAAVSDENGYRGEFDLQNLLPGKYRMEALVDGPIAGYATNPTDYRIIRDQYNPALLPLKLDLKPGGGALIILTEN